jgi:hypothetical protein
MVSLQAEKITFRIFDFKIWNSGIQQIKNLSYGITVWNCGTT